MKERWQQLICRCFETMNFSLFVYSNTTLLEFKTLVLFFFHKSALPDWGAAYLRMWLIHGRFRYYQFRDRMEDSTEELHIKKRHIKN